MKKRVKRLLVSVLALVLAVTSVDLTVLQVQAAAEAKTYNFNQLTEAGTVRETVSAAGALSLTLATQYSEVRFALPDEVDASKITDIKLNVDTTNSLAIKVYTTGWVESSVTNYWSASPKTITDDVRSAGIVGIGIMNCTDPEESRTFNITSVTIYTTDDTEGTEYNFNQFKSRNYIKTISDAGQLDVTFNSNYAEVKYALPADIDAATLQSIVLNKVGDVNHLGYKLYTNTNGWNSEARTVYWNDTLEISDAERAAGITGIGIMLAVDTSADGWESNIPKSYSFSGITFNVDVPAVATEKYYTFKDMTNSGGWGYGTFLNSKGGLYACYSSQYGEAKYDLPAGIELATLEKITLDVTEGNASDMYLKLYVDGTNVQEGGGTSMEMKAETVTALASATKVTLGIQSNASAIASYKIDNVLIKAVQEGGAETEPDTADGATDKVYTFNDITDNGTGYGYTKELATDGKLSISYNGQYQEARYDMPAAVDKTSLQSIIVNVSGGTASDLAIKLMADGTNIQESYSPVLVLSAESAAKVAAATTVSVAIMNNASGAADYVFDGITFRGVHIEEGAVDRYYTFKDMTNSGGWGYGTFLNSKGGLYACYSSQYGEAKYDLPAGIELATLEKIALDVTEGNASDMYLKLYVDGTNVQEGGGTSMEMKAETVTALASATKVTLGIQSNSSAIAGYKIDNILITAKQEGGAETEPDTADSAVNKLYTFNDITDNGTGYGYTKELSAEGKLSISFNGQYQEAKYDLPAAVDKANLQGFVVNVSEGTASNLAIKLIVDGTAVQTVYTPVMMLSAESAAAVASATSVSIGIMNNASDAADYVLDGITFRGVHSTSGEGGSEDEEPLEAQYTFADVKTDVATHNASITVDTNGVATIEFSANYGQVAFTFPEDLDTSLISSLTLVGEDVSGLALKVYADETFTSFDGETKVEYSSSMSINTAITGTLNYFVIMNTSGDAKTYKLAGFDTTVAEAEVETYELTFNAGSGENDLAFLSASSDTASVLEGNAHVLTFTQYNGGYVKFKLPELINMEKCISLTVNVADQVGPVNYYFYSGNTELGKKYYNPANADNKHVIDFSPKLTGKMDTLGVQLGGDSTPENAGIKILSVTFVMEGTKPLDAPTDGVYTYNHFVEQIESDGATVEVNEESLVASIDFAAEGDSVTLPVPDAIDVNHLVSVDRLAEGAENVKLVLLDKDGNVIDSTTESSIEAKCNPEIAFVQLIATAATSFELTGLKFNVDPNAFEAIVLNGYFSREDTSMWSAALWGTVDGTEGGASTTITAATSDTAIGDDIYTYGVVSRRSSPYVCFAQDITDRVTPGKTYTYSFWAKLSEDYEGAPANQREIAFAPFYLDANGVAQYGLVPEGTTIMSLEPGVWAKYSGKVTVPANATGFTIRIVEQGTNYGSGDCVLGSYAVAGVVMEEATASSGTTTSNVFNPASQPIGYSVTYEVEDLVIESSYGVEAEEYTDGVQLNYTGNYGEARFKLPRSLDMSKIVYIEVKMRDQNTPIAVKLYKKGQTEWVSYYNHYEKTYKVIPYNVGEINAVGIMCLTLHDTAYAAVESITFHLTEEPAPLPVYNDIVLNGNFDIEDLADEWKASIWGDGVTITQKVSATPIYGNVYTYGSYSKRTSPYQCFAQDITDRVEEGETYTFSFWARLSSDYAGAPANQRVVEFAPYTVDKDGNPDYNPRLEGTFKQTLEPGVWTKFEGTFKVYNANGIGQVIIRLLEQGTNYGQGDCVMGGYDVTGVVMEKYIPEPPSIDEEVPDLWQALEEDFGEDFMTGTAVTLSEIEDIGVEMLVGKHFNAVTLGNELKPDALFGYSNGAHTKLQTISFKGQNMVVPTLDYSRAEEILDKLLEWNKANPDNQIKVKGHVLVWHAQTPEWFFREGYIVKTKADGTPNYVSAEEMNLRLEWYTKTVLEHFLGEESPYKDLFYAWDVVNEAVGDGTGTYRTNKVSSSESPDADTHGSNSSWWAVYQSNEYIINAFKYANMYAPAHIELYYNDYNECDTSKVKGIVQLLTDVKNAEGTRIDGMGMQGHYNMFNPSIKGMEAAIRAYAEVVDKVVFSELDLKASGDISSEDSLKKEYVTQAERYHDIYLLLLKLHKEGIDIGGITWWGTVDHYSWLQGSSNVGGGADGTMAHCPLLFDTNYKVKPAYWAFVDYTMVDPDWVPEEDTQEDAKDEQSQDKDDTVVEDTQTEDSQAEDTSTDGASEDEKAEDTVEKTDASAKDKKEKKSNALPIAVGGGVGVAAIAGGIFAFLKKRKK